MLAPWKYWVLAQAKSTVNRSDLGSADPFIGPAQSLVRTEAWAIFIPTVTALD